MSAVEQYVAERNATRARVSGLEPHRPYAPVGTPLAYVGRRVVDGQTLALLRAGGEVLVMDVHPDQLARIGRFKAGQAVDVRDGRILSIRGANTAERQADTPINESGRGRGGPARKSGPRR